ncbi:hypothetical protein AeNC1_018629 [Aphanomyces euteiches]|nr:hypothetical protein AeNC1_018629 [Aphanomyces euteiches]
MLKPCNVNGCIHPAVANSWRCRHHRHRGLCIVDNCNNQVYARQLCCRHGAKKTCEHNGCTLRARWNNLCYKHGAQKKPCSEPGCGQPAQARQKCVKHGGGRKCNADGCTAHARAGGFCQRHRTAPQTPPASTDIAARNINMMALWGEAKVVDGRHKWASSHDKSFSLEEQVKIEPGLVCMVDGIDLMTHSGVEPQHYNDDKAMMRDILALLEAL